VSLRGQELSLAGLLMVAGAPLDPYAPPSGICLSFSPEGRPTPPTLQVSDVVLLRVCERQHLFLDYNIRVSTFLKCFF